MSDKNRGAFEAVTKAFADNHAWFQTMCSQKMDGHIAEHFWQAARDRYAPKLTQHEVEIAVGQANVSTEKKPISERVMNALRAAGVQFRDEPNPEPGACQ
jgi:hypothetical protein